MIQFTGYELLWLIFYLFVCRLGVRDRRGDTLAPEVFKPWSCERSLMYSLRSRSCGNDGRIAGTDRNLAVFICITICGSDGIHSGKAD